MGLGLGAPSGTTPTTRNLGVFLLLIPVCDRNAPTCTNSPNYRGPRWLRSIPVPFCRLSARIEFSGDRGLVVTARALARSGLVHEHTFAIDDSIARMTILASNVLMGAFQRKVCLRLVVEERRLPMFRIVTLLAGLRFPRFDELARVRILVAARARCRRRTERRLGELALGTGRLVALFAVNLRVRAKQWELGLGMVETRELEPGLHGVAGLASRRAAVRLFLRHAVAEFTVVRILMAPGARAVIEPVGHDFRGVPSLALRVAFGARHGEVRARQPEAALLMLCDREGRRMESADRVARLAPVVVRRRRKLPLVNVLVAVEAFRERKLVPRRGPRGNVALVARHLGVLSFERIRGESVLLHAEQRRLPAIHGVTGGAFALVLPLRELPAVGIGIVAVRAIRERDLFLEIAVRVALQAIHLRVLAEQGKLRLGVIELLARRNLLPAGSGVARLAGLRERAVMRIGVAITALGKGNAGEPRLPARRRGGMALLARDLCVKARQRESRLGVIEICRCFPVVEVVALETILAELSFVRVLVARHALLRQSEERPVQILHLNERPDGPLDVGGGMALGASDPRVLPLQGITRFAVVEFLERRLPVDQREVFAIVLRMAFRAVVLVGIMCVQPMAGRKLRRDFFVALLALQDLRAFSDAMAAGALRRPAERSVRF